MILEKPLLVDEADDEEQKEEQEQNPPFDYNAPSNFSFRKWIKIYKSWAWIPFLIGVGFLIADSFIYIEYGLNWCLITGMVLIAFPLISHVFFFIVFYFKERDWSWSIHSCREGRQPFHGKLLKEDDYAGESTVDFPV